MTASSVCTASTGYAPGGRLARQHDRVGAFVDGIGRVADLGAGRPRLDAHRLEAPASRRSPAGPRARAHADDLLLHARHLLERHLETEIAARHHHALRESQDRVEFSIAAGRSILAMIGVDSTGVVDDRPRPRDIVCGLHEAERHEVDAEREAEPQIVDVLVGERRWRQRDARSVDALVLAEQAAVDDNDFEARRLIVRATRSSIRPSSSSRRSPGCADRTSSA